VPEFIKLLAITMLYARHYAVINFSEREEKMKKSQKFPPKAKKPSRELHMNFTWSYHKYTHKH